VAARKLITSAGWRIGFPLRSKPAATAGVMLLKRKMLNKTEYHSAHQHSSLHRKQVLSSDLCGCFYCLAIYPPSKIVEWVDEDDNGVGQTAMCPECGIDSVIGSKSGVPLTKDFLQNMHKIWF
jgi:hypothetical protein